MEHPEPSSLVAELLSVAAIHMPVLSATDVVVSKLHALTEHHCDLEPVFSVLRSVREQVDVDRLDAACAGQPFAETGLFVARRLGLLPPAADPAAAAAAAAAAATAGGRPSARVVPGAEDLGRPADQDPDGDE